MWSFCKSCVRNHSSMPGPDRWRIRGLHEWTLSKRWAIAVGGVDLLFEGSMEACSRVCVNMLIAFRIPATWGSVGDKRFHAADVYGEPEPVQVALTHGMLLLL